MTNKKLLENTKDFCVNELREVQTDNLYFGEDKNGKCQGSIYWVEGATTWLYYCNGKSEYGECDDLLHGMKKKILLSYYESNKEEIDEWVKDQKESKENKENKFEIRI
jgi:hypothetical protein